MRGKANLWKDQVVLYFLSIGVIEVDNEGRIWKVKDKRGRPYKWRYVKTHDIGFLNKQGYIQITLWLNRKRYTTRAHRIVWLSHNGLIPTELEINHKNGDKADNKIENLELVTPSENIKHGFRVLGRISLKGEHHNMAKLKEKDIVG
ncbi:unnamed protein product, partial [marine sediment metagenome]